MSDRLYIYGCQRLTASMVSLFSFCIFLVGVVVQYQDMTNTLHIIRFSHELKTNTIKYPLNRRNYRIFSLRMHLMTKYLMKNIFYLTVILTELVLIVALILSYFDPESNFTILSDIIEIILNLNYVL